MLRDGFWLSPDLLVQLTFVLVIVAFLAEGMQYMAAAIVAKKAVDYVDNIANVGKEWEYLPETLGRFGWRLYKLRFIAFYLKLVLALLATLCFVLIALSLEQIPVTASK